tara:strand:- start:355 stop:534 length:180 start_codon:yes stop_codon:yes gene_type:complete
MSTFTVDGVEYNCVEQYLMYQKAVLFKDDEAAAQIMEADKPGKQKKLGRGVRGFNEKVT